MSRFRPITLYNADTGLITRGKRIVAGRDPVVTRPGEAWKWGRHDPGRERIDPATGEAVPLEAPDVAIEGNRLTGVPAGARVCVGATTFEATGEPIDITVTVPETVRVWVRDGHRFVEHNEVPFDPAANRTAGRGTQAVELRQDPVRMRLREYPADGDQLDALAKALSEIIDAHPQLRGPGVEELRGIIARRNHVKAKLRGRSK